MKPLDSYQKLALSSGRIAIEGPPGSGKSNTAEGYVRWQKTQDKEVLVFVRKRMEAETLKSRGVRSSTLQSHRFKALGYPEIRSPKDLGLLLEAKQEEEKLSRALVVDEIHNWSAEFFDVARSLWAEEDFICFFDEHQSLMYWAGAVRDLREELSWTFGINKVIHLVNNYRSTPTVVEVLKAIVPREMVSRALLGKGYFHLERCYNLDDECRFLYNRLLNGYEDVQVLARNSSICKRVSEFLYDKGVNHKLYLSGGKLPVHSGVIVQTVHTAQATEHMTVFMLGVTQGVLPDYRGNLSDEHNVFYVGCSRAKRDLFISYHGTPSLFITKEVKCLSGI